MSDERDLLRDSAEHYLRDAYDFAARQGVADSGNPVDETHWQAFTDMGWTAITLPETLGGLGLGMSAAASLAELWGYHLVREPLLESAVLAGGVLARATGAATEQLAAGIIDGSVRATVSLGSHSPLTLTTKGKEKSLTGRLEFVTAGGSATHLIAEAVEGARSCWVVVDLSATGATRHCFMNHDGRMGAHIALDTLIGDEVILVAEDAGAGIRGDLLQRALLLAANESVGLMQGALDLTVDYTKQREQFGQPLSGFQALQHRMSDMLIQTELTRSLALAACSAYDAGRPDAVQLGLAAKAKADSAARRVTQEAIQLHGGIATTNEYRVGHYFKRATLLESWPLHRDAVIEQFVERHRGMAS